MRPPLWQILVATIPHRHDRLCALLDTLAAQMVPGVRVLVFRDNLELGYGAKCEALARAATGRYTSHYNDDDSCTAGFVPAVVRALRSRPGPHYVGFEVGYTEDGAPQQRCVHSLAYPDWGNTPDLIYRDITHLNPIRREIADRATFAGHAITDRDWADEIRATGLVRREAFVGGERYLYQHSSADFILTPRSPLPAGEIPPLPAGYPFVDYLEGA